MATRKRKPAPKQPPEPWDFAGFKTNTFKSKEIEIGQEVRSTATKQNGTVRKKDKTGFLIRWDNSGTSFIAWGAPSTIKLLQ